VLERASVSPTRRLGQTEGVFHRAALRGSLHAVRDDSKVVALLQELEGLFTPDPSEDKATGIEESKRR